MSRPEELTKTLPHPAPATSPRTLLQSHDYEGMLRKFHHHNLSDSTNTIGSNDSSPTTTISTVDDSSATEPSPGSSPESPPPSTFAVGMLRPRTADDGRGAFFELQKSPPPRKGRNLKNLAVNTARQPLRASSTTSLPLSVQTETNAAILSPSFVKPPTPPRRRPSNLGLTIQPPAVGKAAPQEVKLMIPPTPGFGRPATLRQYQSSPSLPLVSGLGLPHTSQIVQQQRTLDTIFSPSEKVPTPTVEEEEQNFDIPLSREEKPEAYPDGPICVYEPGIDLYLEPTAEQCRQYDVIMNVASEVRNPMVEPVAPAPAEPEVRLDGGGGIQYAPKRTHLAVRSQNGDTPSEETSPSTPKATPSEARFPSISLAAIPEKDPEYIHVPWEHNSDIVPDLLDLVKLIDEKVTQGRKILIHCQCGVSRSASLVVAYGLYKDPSLSVQEAYDAVKKRSKWIGPNMNFIMQLQEFRSSLARGGLLKGNRGVSPVTPGSALSEWKSPFSHSISSPLSAKEHPASAARSPSVQPPAADDVTSLSSGPSSAPSGVSWPSPDERTGPTVSALKVDPSGHVVPVLQVIDTDLISIEPPNSEIKHLDLLPTTTVIEPGMTSPRSAEFAMIPVKPPEDADPVDNFGILSPTSTEFVPRPFDRSALLASLGMGSVHPDQESPRRSTSLSKHKHTTGLTQQNGHARGTPKAPLPPLRGKISSPNLREQQQLQSLQARIEASLPMRSLSVSSHKLSSSVDDEPLSPRAAEITSNPFALAHSLYPTTTTTCSNSTKHRNADEDPRSPAHKGASPITRNILDVL